MLTLDEIENVSFRKAGLGGYKTEDVDNFVDSVILKVKDLEIANKELQERIEQLNKKIIKYEDKAESVQDAIITAEATAKRLVKEATEKSETMLKDATVQAEKTLSDANEKAEKTVAEANAKAEKTLLESETKAEAVLNDVLSKSADSVNENNRIIEAQKKQIKKIQDNVVKFKKSLISSYKEQIALINSLSYADKIDRYRKELENGSMKYVPNTPESIGNDAKANAQKAADEAVKKLSEKRNSEAEVKKDTPKPSANNSSDNKENTQQPKINKTESESDDAQTAKPQKAEDKKTEKTKEIDSDTNEIKINISDLKSEIKKAKEKSAAQKNFDDKFDEIEIEIDDGEVDEYGEIFSSSSVEEELKSTDN